MHDDAATYKRWCPTATQPLRNAILPCTVDRYRAPRASVHDACRANASAQASCSRVRAFVRAPFCVALEHGITFAAKAFGSAGGGDYMPSDDLIGFMRCDATSAAGMWP
jgi:hypothetical protein